MSRLPAPLAALLIAALLPHAARADDTLAALETQFKAAKAAYAQNLRDKQPDATATYMNALATVLDGLVEQHARTNDQSGDKLTAQVDAELKKHPVSAKSDSAALTRLRVGKWQSPRHDYLYRADGTWLMEPDEGGGPNGHWRIAGGRYYDGMDATFTARDTFILLLANQKYFIFTDGGTYVFFERRLAK